MNAGADRKVVFALLGIAALCLIGLGVSLYRAKSSELKKLHTNLVSKEKQLDDVRGKLAKQPDLETKYATLQARLSVLEPSLPDSAYMPTFLRQIERLALTTDNAIVGIRPKNKVSSGQKPAPVKVNDETGEVMKPATAEEKADKAGDKNGKGAKDKEKSKVPYDYSSIELKLEGTYTTLLAFLEALQKFPKMIAVNDVSFQPKSGVKEERRAPALTATMELTAVVTKGGKDGTS